MTTQRTGAIILRTSIFDGATIIESGTGDVAGFPVTNLQHPQPRVKWISDDAENTFFVVDLQQTIPRTFLPIYNAVSALFYNARGGSKWRVRTGPTPTGTGSFDSGEVFLWPGGSGGPTDFRSTLAYQGAGSHAHMLMTASPYSPTETINDEFQNFLVFPGTSGSFVEFGDALDPLIIQGAVITLDLRFRNAGPAANQMLFQKGVFSVNAGTFTGFFIGLTSTGTIKAGIGDSATGVIVREGGSYTDNDWHTVRLQAELFQGFDGTLQLFVDGALVVTGVNATVDDPTNAAPIRWGASSTGTQLFSGDIERAILSRGDSFDIASIDDFHDLYMQSAEPDTLEYPSFVGGAWTVNEGTGTAVGNRVGGDLNTNGSLLGSVTWSHLSSFYGDRYMRVDFLPVFLGIDTQFKLARFVVDLALEPIVPAPYGKPTPIGSPAKNRVSWRVALTQEQFESIAYSLAQRSGSSPRTLRSWGYDTFLLDGAETVVACNNALATESWSRHQQTVYGYIESLSPVSVQGDLHITDISIQGI